MKPTECAACKAPSEQLSAFDPGLDTHGISIFGCRSCGSFTMWPQPDKDYSAHTTETSAWRDYVEMNCSIHDIVSSVMPAVYAGTAQRYLDVGCGFGFSLDIVRRLTRSEVLGVEPAHYGQLGRELLGIPVLSVTLAGGPETRREPELRDPFDVIFSSEVVEHVTDPDGFLGTLKAYLRPDGILAITTPRAEALNEPRRNNEKLAVISPGAHVFLYSRAALLDALRRAGFDHIVVREANVTRIVYASTRPLAIPEMDAGVATMQYLRLALGEGDPRDTVKTGLQYRLYRNLVERADWAGASELDEEIEFVQAPESLRYDRYSDFLQDYRACDPTLCYLRGMLYLNYRGAYEDSRDWFLSAFRFCVEKLRIAPGEAIVESDLVWRALFHAALAARHAGLPDQVRSIWVKSEMARSVGFLPPIPEDIISRLEDDLHLHSIT
ncbi:MULTISPECIES: class I SAM-dependent methyltransferase [Hyphobacterium]|uniref:Class I SAM-dependent methyltransferase n=1 Tax=Hyphobacterium vulgare TaxID=1736751 RepID=A0ABV6ZWP0_9PROT